MQFVRMGKYQITVTLAGFQTFKATGVDVGNNQVVRRDAVLQVGDLSETVAVVAEAIVLDTDNATVSETLNQRLVAEAPLSGTQRVEPGRHDTWCPRRQQQLHWRRPARPAKQLDAGRHQRRRELHDANQHAADCRRRHRGERADRQHVSRVRLVSRRPREHCHEERNQQPAWLRVRVPPGQRPRRTRLLRRPRHAGEPASLRPVRIPDRRSGHPAEALRRPQQDVLHDGLRGRARRRDEHRHSVGHHGTDAAR